MKDKELGWNEKTLVQKFNFITAFAQALVWVSAPLVLSIVLFKWWGLLGIFLYTYPIHLKVYDSFEEFYKTHDKNTLVKTNWMKKFKGE